MILEIKPVTLEMRDKLRAPLPSEAVKPHPTKTYLSSIKPIYVTERLNDVFGIGAWQVRTEMIERNENGTVVVKTVLEVPEYGIYYEAFGGNDNGGGGSKNFDLGDAYKGATTDGLTKITSYMEIGIDVFKGKSTPPPKKAADKPEATIPPANGAPKKEWLNPKTPAWDHTLERMRGGMKLEDVKKFFLISKVNEQSLLNEVKNETQAQA